MQVGKYSPVQRAATVLYRGTQFFAVSFAASMVGHSLTKYLVSHTCHMMTPLRVPGGLGWGGLLGSRGQGGARHDQTCRRHDHAVHFTHLFMGSLMLNQSSLMHAVCV